MKNTQLVKTTTDPKILDELSKDEYWRVRYWVAQNPNTTSETLDYLSKDENYNVRYRAVENLNNMSKKLEDDLIMQIENDIINSLTEREKKIYEIK